MHICIVDKCANINYPIILNILRYPSKKLLIVKLPNGHLVDLGNKIEEYSLNLNHQAGKNKAILFASKLGINLENAELLKQALKEAAINEDVIIQKTNEYGTHYNMKFWLQTEVGESLILAAWIVRSGENFPRLTNCYPVKK